MAGWSDLKERIHFFWQWWCWCFRPLSSTIGYISACIQQNIQPEPSTCVFKHGNTDDHYSTWRNYRMSINTWRLIRLTEVPVAKFQYVQDVWWIRIRSAYPAPLALCLSSTSTLGRRTGYWSAPRLLPVHGGKILSRAWGPSSRRQVHNIDPKEQQE